VALPRQYAGQPCSIARALEVIGERWSLLIVRDAFFGVSRFSDFAAHLDIPRAVLTERLGFLVDEGILDRVDGRYALSDKGLALWPILRSLGAWGDAFYAPAGPRRVFRHAECGTRLDASGVCPTCQRTPLPSELDVLPGPGLAAGPPRDDAVSAALRQPHHLLDPLPA
jgi:DNA-binding HxlR family transcriptional regulator